MLGYLLLFPAEAYVTFAVVYYFFLLLLLLTRGRTESGTCRHPATRFGILIPAHNEEGVIGNLFEALRGLEYPNHLYDAWVIADNCSDRTKEVAARYGAKVFERRDDRNRGKGFALSWAMENTDILENDAVVVIDADCVPEVNFLAVMDSKLRSNCSVVQAYNGSYVPAAGSPGAALLHVGNLMENRFFCYPKSLLKNGAVFLQGTGMCFSRHVLRKFPWNAFSIVEDIEYSLSLIAGGERIAYTIQTSVFTHEPETGKAMRGQKLRSAAGLAAVIRKNLVPLLKTGIGKKDAAMIDAAMSLLLLNKSFVAVVMAAALAASLVLDNMALIALNSSLLGLMAFYVGFGFLSAGAGRRKLIRMVLHLPLFFIRMTAINILGIFGYKRNDWARTERPPIR